VLRSADPEHLHQLRVGLRRLRAALRAYRKILPRKKSGRVVRELRRLSPVLGNARDWDVLIGRSAPDARMRARAGAAREAAIAALGRAKFARLLGAARALRAAPADQPLDAFAAASLERAHRKLMKAARRMDWTDERRRHAVRIRVKRLRYACEFFAPIFDAGRFLDSLKLLQQILGELNDIAVGRRLAAVHVDEKPLLGKLSVAWARFAKRPPFWRVAARRPRRAARRTAADGLARARAGRRPPRRRGAPAE
jgi:CHAD domain-containing protein